MWLLGRRREHGGRDRGECGRDQNLPVSLTKKLNPPDPVKG